MSGLLKINSSLVQQGIDLNYDKTLSFNSFQTFFPHILLFRSEVGKQDNTDQVFLRRLHDKETERMIAPSVWYPATSGSAYS